ncbi:MAG TPA: PilZ domain-containing protein [Spirochaetia bacterium]|nr:PilZ domain-containing protein [Spirochaetia bacterium]
MANELNRIEKEFILKTLLDNKTVIEVHIGSQRVISVLTSIRPGILFLELKSQAAVSRPIQAGFYFRFRGNPMTFKSTITAKKEGVLQVREPKEILRDLSRGFERILSPDGIRVTFLVDGTEVELNYPKAEIEDRKVPPSLAAGFDAARIADLLKSFRERSHEFASENKIIMFRERKPETFEERVIAASGKILVLPFMPPETPGLNSIIRERLLTEQDSVRAETNSGGEVFTALQHIAAINDQQKQRGVSAELYCPVLHESYVAGYLYLLRSRELTPQFDPKVVEFVFQFSRVLAYSLMMNGYFKAEPVKREFGASELLDISGSGLLFGYPKDGPSLLLYSDIDLTIHLGDSTVTAKSRVMRRYADNERVYLGVRFMDMSLEDMEVLFQRLYGRDYVGDIDNKGLADLSILPESDR